MKIVNLLTIASLVVFGLVAVAEDSVNNPSAPAVTSAPTASPSPSVKKEMKKAKHKKGKKSAKASKKAADSGNSNTVSKQ